LKRSSIVRLAALAALVLAALSAAAPATPPAAAPRQREFVEAVDFPYYLYPRSLWDRELVWLKNIGVRTVEFSIPWNWHQVKPGDYDFTGRTSERRDLAGFIRRLRRLGLRAWIRPLPPTPGWRDDGPAPRQWQAALSNLLAPQTVSHGGPIAWVEGREPALDAPAPPGPVITISATDSAALARSREALHTARGSLLWINVEDKLYPAGWEPAGMPLLQGGAVGLSGDERPNALALRRSAALLRHWSPLIPAMQQVALPKASEDKLPDAISVAELASGPVSAVSVTNRGGAPFHGDLRVFEPLTKHTMVVPSVTVPPGDSLWLPLNVSLAANGLCPDCSNFSSMERLVYASAELLSVEFENGILAMEFAAPAEGEAVLQLERKPVGPYLAAGIPADFEWDDKTLRLRLPIPASRTPDHRVRVGIAIEEPETSAFFSDAHRLIIGQPNTVETLYSSPKVAARSRLRLPESFTATSENKSPNEIEYQVTVPPDALHGSYADMALEADGMPLGRARVQLFRPVSVRIVDAMHTHFGQHAEFTPDPPIVAIEPRAGTNIEVSLRNNWPSIETYKLVFSGDGLDFFQPKTEISIAAIDERQINLRILASQDSSGGVLRDWRLHLTGAGEADLPMRAVLVPKGRTVAWSADLYGDGETEWVLESQQARAIFSTRDGGRWLEFTSKEANSNFLPDAGAFSGSGAVTVMADGDTLKFIGPSWRRSARLAGGVLSIEQSTPLAADGIEPQKQSGIALTIEHPSAHRAIYTLQ
jgi:hypothetical protein